MRKPMVIHPFLFAIFPVVFLISHNVTQVSLREAIRPTLVIIGASCLMWLVLSWLLKDTRKGAILVSSLLLLFFSHGHLYTIIKAQGWSVAGIVISGKHKYIFLLAAVIFGSVTYAVARSRSDLHRLTAALNVVAAFLVAIPASTAIYSIAARPEISVQTRVNNSPHPIKPGGRPDIYYIILDSYGRADVLQDVYQYDNSEFIDYLRQKGFYVANKSRANYYGTMESLPSSLNLTYLDTAEVASHVRERLSARMIRDNYVSHFLRQHGYLFVTFSSGISFTEIPTADVYIAPPWCLSEFENVLIDTTPIPVLHHRLLHRVTADWQYASHRHRLLYIFDHLAAMREMDSPVFVFAHIMVPHPPFVFDEHGEPIRPNRPFAFADGPWFMKGGGDRDEYIENYRRQLTFVNQKTREAIDNILAKSRESPIIILQSDTGPASKLSYENLADTNLKERLSILNAYYLPDNGCQELYDEITPVNTFRIVFNHYFGTDYELLEDRSYFEIWGHPGFIDVTEEITAD